MDNVVSWIVLAVLAIGIAFYILNKMDVKESKKETKCNTYNKIEWK